MTVGLSAVDLGALQHPLAFAAKNGFKQLGEISGLGDTLRSAATRLAGVFDDDSAQKLHHYAQQLKGFEQRSHSERARLVALGLRLVATLKDPAAAGQGKHRRPGPSLGRSKSTTPDPVTSSCCRTGPASPLSPLERSVTDLKGIGSTLAGRLAHRGIRTLEDLLFLLPSAYRDYRDLVPIDELIPGQRANVRAFVVHVNTRGRPRQGGRRGITVEAGLAEEAGGIARLWCVWFQGNQGLAQQLEQDRELLVSGVVTKYRDRLQIVHPDMCAPDQATLRACYPAIEGVAPRILARACRQACDELADHAPDGLPGAVCKDLGLPNQADALRQLHLVGQDDYERSVSQQLQARRHPAQQRLVLDELFSLQLALAVRRQRQRSMDGLPCKIDATTLGRLEQTLPFALTGAQRRVIDEVLDDVTSSRPMSRLLQGDVGSGKTVVAFVACLAAIDSGMQAAIMAPTEILAQQHAQTLAPWCEALGVRWATLTASTPRGVRESLLALADGASVDLLLGTHALLAPRVSLPNLAMVVVDEQHRFGVEQRARLTERSGGPRPHLLVMSATPIPRSVALTVFGDLDLSVLDEKPPGREPPQTSLFSGGECTKRSPAHRVIAAALNRSDQAFVVCPLVEESEKLAVTDVQTASRRLADLFVGARVGMVHGRLPNAERSAVVRAFRERQLDILVATTVIEVGIDIPQANLMVIEHAERFGLAQLHQLRGRVGRGGGSSQCLLLCGAGPDTPSYQRLKKLADTEDGFALAEADLELRGPGELFGTRQSGVPRLRFANLKDHFALLNQARDLAQATVERDPELSAPEHRDPRRVMLQRWQHSALFGAEAG